jgi:hypothetical protein
MPFEKVVREGAELRRVSLVTDDVVLGFIGKDTADAATLLARMQANPGILISTSQPSTYVRWVAADKIVEASPSAEKSEERARYDMQLEAAERIYQRRQDMATMIVIQELMIQNNLTSLSLDYQQFRSLTERQLQGYVLEARTTADNETLVTYRITKGDPL